MHTRPAHRHCNEVRVVTIEISYKAYNFSDSGYRVFSEYLDFAVSVSVVPNVLPSQLRRNQEKKKSLRAKS